MAITTAQNADHKSLTGKTLSIQAELTSKLKSSIVDVTYGASDNYVTDGNVVDLSLGGRISTIIGAQVLHSSADLFLQYSPAAAGDAATGKIKAYGEHLTELASADTGVNSLVIRIRIIGY